MRAEEWSGLQKAEGAGRPVRMLSKKGGHEKTVVWMERRSKPTVRSHVLELDLTGLADDRNVEEKEGESEGNRDGEPWMRQREGWFGWAMPF